MSEKVIFFDRVHIIITNRGKSPFANILYQYQTRF